MTISRSKHPADLLRVRLAILASTELPDDPFTRSDWQRAPLVADLALRPDLVKLLRAPDDIGEPVVAIAGVTDYFPEFQSDFVCPLEESVLRAIRDTSVLAHCHSHLFDIGGEWAVAVSPDGYGILGVSPRWLQAKPRATPLLSLWAAEFRNCVRSGEFGREQRSVAALLALSARFGYSDD